MHKIYILNDKILNCSCQSKDCKNKASVAFLYAGDYDDNYNAICNECFDKIKEKSIIEN